MVHSVVESVISLTYYSLLRLHSSSLLFLCIKLKEEKFTCLPLAQNAQKLCNPRMDISRAAQCTVYLDLNQIISFCTSNISYFKMPQRESVMDIPNRLIIFH